VKKKPGKKPVEEVEKPTPDEQEPEEDEEDSDDSGDGQEGEDQGDDSSDQEDDGDGDDETEDDGSEDDGEDEMENEDDMPEAAEPRKKPLKKAVTLMPASDLVKGLGEVLGEIFSDELAPVLATLKRQSTEIKELKAAQAEQAEALTKALGDYAEANEQLVKGLVGEQEDAAKSTPLVSTKPLGAGGIVEKAVTQVDVTPAGIGVVDGPTYDRKAFRETIPEALSKGLITGDDVYAFSDGSLTDERANEILKALGQ